MNIDFLHKKPQSLEAAFSRTRILHMVFLAAPILYTGVVYGLKQFAMPSDSGFVGVDENIYQLLYWANWFVLLVASVMIFFVLPRFSSPLVVAEKYKDASAELFWESIQRGHFLKVGWIMFVAIFALTLFLLNGNFLNFVPFMAIVFILLLLNFPRRAEWDRATDLFRGAS